MTSRTLSSVTRLFIHTRALFVLTWKREGQGQGLLGQQDPQRAAPGTLLLSLQQLARG